MLTRMFFPAHSTAITLDNMATAALLGPYAPRVVVRGDAGNRADIDDVAPALLDHDPRRGLAAQEGAFKIDVDYPVPILLAQLLHRPSQRDAGNVGQNVDPPSVLTAVPTICSTCARCETSTRQVSARRPNAWISSRT